jgi:Matrixin
MNQFFGLLLAVALAVSPNLAAAYAYETATADGQNVQQSQVIGNPVIWYNPLQNIVFNFGGAYDDSAVSAMSDWNMVSTPFQWSLGTASAQPCNSMDHINSASWRTSPCGASDPNAGFGDALAVTKRSYEKVGGIWYLADTDIVVDSTQLWDPNYSGPTRVNSIGQKIHDFRRVILHELGHALGLDHPDDAGQNVAAIMNSQISEINSLQPDDIDGITALYSDVTARTSNSAYQTESRVGIGSVVWYTPSLLSVALWRRRKTRK